MKISKIEHIHHEVPVPVYDVINVEPYHNFSILSNNNIVISHNCVMDETNFAKAGVKDINLAKAHMKKLYDTINARISGTFRIKGEVYGKLVTSSSKNTDSDFLSDHIETQLNAGNTHMLLIDEPQWKILPPSMFSDEKFHFTVGDRYKRGFVVPEEHEDEMHLREYEEQGYQVIEAPLELKKNFLADYDISLRDIAGISVAGAMGFITQEAITPNVSQERFNPFFTDTIQVGSKDNATIEQFFHLEVVPQRLKHCTMNIHLDLAEVNDRCGISGGCIDGNKIVEDFEGRKVSQPFFKQVFQIGVEAPRGDRMSFQKVVNFLVWLRRNGFHIGTISTDQYQSSYLREILNQQGFDTTKISVDASDEPYIGLKNALNDQRIELIKHQLQEDEMVKLQRLGNKIDHPPNGCFAGDTKISLVDGRELTINELLIEQQYRTNWVYTVNESTKLIEPKPIKKVFQTKLVKELVKVTLDNGESFECTPEHLLMLRDGEYAEAQSLTPGTSMMPLYTKISDKGLVGYRLFYEPAEDKWHYEHKRFCPDRLPKGVVAHHANFNKLDNTPTNLQRKTKSQHRRIHNNSTQDYNKTSQGVKNWHSNMRGTEEYASRSEKLRQIMLSKRTVEAQERIDAEASRIARMEAYFNIHWDELSANEKNSYSNRFHKIEDPIGTSKKYADAKAKVTKQAESKRRSILSKVMSSMRWYTNGIDNIYIKPDTVIPEGYYPGRVMNRKNHKIVSVEFIHKCCKVYDLEIVDNHNFALAAGIFVHNSKDCSDALCGWMWTLTIDAPPTTPPPSKTASAIASVNGRRGMSGRNTIPSVMNNNSIKRYT